MAAACRRPRSRARPRSADACWTHTAACCPERPSCSGTRRRGCSAEVVSSADGAYFAERRDARRVRALRGADGVQEVHAPRRASRGREDGHRGHRPRGGRTRRGAHGHRGDADRRRHLQGGGRPHHERRADRPAQPQPQLHRLRRPAAGTGAGHGRGRLVRRGLGRRQRTGPPQQQLHAGRGQQQRRHLRTVGGAPGPHPDRGGAGVPGPDQPVRRGVRADDGRGRERHHQAGHQRLPRERLRFPAGRLPDPEGLLRQAGEPAQARHHLPAVRLHRGRTGGQGTRPTSSPAWNAWSSTRRAPSTSRRGPSSMRPPPPTTGSGTRSSASTTRSAPATPGTCAGCGSTRWRPTSSPPA